MVAAVAKTQKAMASAAVMAHSSAAEKCLCAHPAATTAPIASISEMIDFHGLVFALTLATWADRSICGPPCTCIQRILPSRPNRLPYGTGANGTTRAGRPMAKYAIVPGAQR